MNKISVAFTLATALMAVWTGSASAAGDLFLYNWSDYTSPDLLKKFEAETGIKVTLDVYDSNETLLAKMKQGNATYDIVVPSHNFVPILIKEGLLRPINADRLPDYGNIDAKWQSPAWDPNNVYTVPWVWGTTSFAVDTSVYKGPLDSSALLFQPPAELQGKIGMFKTPEEVIAMSEIFLGLPHCDDNPKDIQKIYDLLAKQKPFVKVYNSDGTRERLGAGEVAVSMTWNGDAKRARDLRPSVAYVYPSQGVLAFMDNLAVPKNAPHYDNALKFVAFMLKPENAAIQSNFAKYSNAIKGSQALLGEDIKTAPEINPPATIKLVFQPVCSEATVKLRDRIWTKLLQ